VAVGGSTRTVWSPPAARQRGYAIRICADEDDALDSMVIRVSGDIQSDPHIHPFLLEYRLKVGIS